MNPGLAVQDIFFSDLTMFYPANPCFGAKLSICVASPTKNTTMYGYRFYGYQQKFSISSSKRFMKPRRGIKDICLAQHHHIIHSQPLLRSNVEYFCGYFDQTHNCIWSLIVRILIKVIIGSSERYINPGLAIRDRFLVPPHHFLLSQSIFWRKTDTFCCCSGPKHMCVWL